MGLRRAILVCSVVLIAGTPARATAADATGPLAPVERGLRGHGMYVDPHPAVDFPPADQRIVGEVIARAGQPVFVAVLEARGRGEAKLVARRLAQDTGREGTYVVFVGRKYWITSDLVQPPGAALETFRAALAEHRAGGLVAVLSTFVLRLQARRLAGVSGTPAPLTGDPGKPADDRAAGDILGVGVALAIFAAAFGLYRRRGRGGGLGRLGGRDRRQYDDPYPSHQMNQGASGATHSSGGGHGGDHGHGGHHAFDSGGGGSWDSGGGGGGGGGGDSGGGGGGGDSGGGGSY